MDLQVICESYLGTGKTSTILAISKHLYGNYANVYVLELNASDDRGINVVRDKIKTFAEALNRFVPSSDNPANQVKTNLKLIILDEADQMTNASQGALRRIMEIYAKNVRFCLICNYMHKIISPIQSRCTGFRFSPLDENDLRRRTLEIATNEGITLEENGLSALIEIAQGDMRKVLNTFQIAAMSKLDSQDRNIIDVNDILNASGTPLEDEVKSIFNALVQSTFSECIQIIRHVQELKGYSLQDLVTCLYKLIIKIDWPTIVIVQLIIRMADIEERLATGANENIQICALVSAFTEARFEIERIKFEISH